MKPKKPFMVEVNNGSSYLRKTPVRVRAVDWDGTQFATSEEAEAVCNVYRALWPDARVIEIMDVLRVRV
jgi:hypothetical protein